MVHGFIPLSDHGVIAVSGADARTFLNGQLTSDMLHLLDDRAQLAGYCSAKGRLLALFTAFTASNGDVLLECDTSLLAPTLKRLQMFVMRAQCKLRDAHTEYRIIGFAGINYALLGFTQHSIWSVQRNDYGTLIRFPDAAQTTRYWLVYAVEQHDALIAKLANEPELSRTQWDALQVQAAVPRITAPVVEQFVPQMINLEALGGVNFKKGCYPGQEVVARSQYRGTLKRRMFPIAALDESASMSAGQEIFSSNDATQPVGMVVLGAGRDALVELKLNALEPVDSIISSLHLSAADGPELRVGTLPYALPTEV
jgi:tRNA-modifying protein YgfZ